MVTLMGYEHQRNWQQILWFWNNDTNNMMMIMMIWFGRNVQGSNTTMCLYGVWEGITPTCAEVMKMLMLMVVKMMMIMMMILEWCYRQWSILAVSSLDDRYGDNIRECDNHLFQGLLPLAGISWGRKGKYNNRILSKHKFSSNVTTIYRYTNLEYIIIIKKLVYQDATGGQHGPLWLP